MRHDLSRSVETPLAQLTPEQLEQQFVALISDARERIGALG
ncbi:MAG: hypothetical protein U0S48_06935 [Solirubrobacteraceae bacterium]